MDFGIFELTFALLLFVGVLACILGIREIYTRRRNQRLRNISYNETSSLLMDDSVDAYHINVNNLAYQEDMKHGRLTTGDYVAYYDGKLIDSKMHYHLLNVDNIDGGPVFTGKVGDEILVERAF